MQDFVKKAESFITFDMPLRADFISTQFEGIHRQCKKEFPDWSPDATKQKVIATYWLIHVLQHCLFLISTSALIVLVTKPSITTSFLFGLFVAIMVTLPLLFMSHYWPAYSYDFLPKLETVKANFEAMQKDQLEKCRQAQLSNFSLSLIFYVLDKTSEINWLQCNDRSAALLTKLYGVDQGSMKKNLELILGKKRQLLPRKYTEIHNRFDEAYMFFEGLQFTKGMQTLKELETKFRS